MYPSSSIRNQNYNLASRSVAVIDWSQWFDHAWLFKGAETLDDGMLDLVGSQELSQYGVNWNAVDGAIFDGATSYIETNLVPQMSPLWTVMVRFSGVVNDATTLLGEYRNNQREFTIKVDPSSGTGVRYCYGNAITVGPGMESGVLAIAGDTVYRNGIAEGTITIPATTPSYTIWLGYGHQQYPGLCNIQAFGQKVGVLDASEVLAASLAMASI